MDCKKKEFKWEKTSNRAEVIDSMEKYPQK